MLQAISISFGCLEVHAHLVESNTLLLLWGFLPGAFLQKVNSISGALPQCPDASKNGKLGFSSIIKVIIDCPYSQATLDALVKSVYAKETNINADNVVDFVLLANFLQVCRLELYTATWSAPCQSSCTQKLPSSLTPCCGIRAHFPGLDKEMSCEMLASVSDVVFTHPHRPLLPFSSEVFPFHKLAKGLPSTDLHGLQTRSFQSIILTRRESLILRLGTYPLCRLSGQSARYFQSSTPAACSRSQLRSSGLVTTYIIQDW